MSPAATPPAAGRDGQWNPPQHASSRTGCPLPTLRRLPCANLCETAGGGCRRPLARPQEKDRAGRERHPKPCTGARSRRFSLSLTPRLERCCCRKVAMRRAAPSRLSPRVPSPECRTMGSESCCSADSAYLSRSPRNAALAGDSWTCTATTGRPAHRWECWRGQRLASARRPVTQQTALKSHWGRSWRATSHQRPVDSERLE